MINGERTPESLPIASLGDITVAVVAVVASVFLLKTFLAIDFSFTAGVGC